MKEITLRRAEDATDLGVIVTGLLSIQRFSDSAVVLFSADRLRELMSAPAQTQLKVGDKTVSAEDFRKEYGVNGVTWYTDHRGLAYLRGQWYNYQAEERRRLERRRLEGED